MSATLEYLQALRDVQLGKARDDLEDLARAAKDANRAAVVSPPRKRQPRVRLTITPHARKRMQERGMTAADVASIYIHGDQQADRRHANRTRYRVTEKGLALCDRDVARRLGRHLGSVVVVASPTADEPSPVVITVLPFGLDTR